MDNPETHGEIIIVRRSNAGEEGYHGGAWKIAYADFMTAMMAFFLVMWLTNAASEETKIAVANYFNPLKLVDTRTNTRGLNDVPDTPLKKGAGDATGGKNDEVADVPSKIERDVEDNVTYYPFLTIKAIAAQDGVIPEGAGGASTGGSSAGSASGTASRDPFSPDYYKDVSPEISLTDRDGGKEPQIENTVKPQTAGAAGTEQAEDAGTSEIGRMAAEIQAREEALKQVGENGGQPAASEVKNGAADKIAMENAATGKENSDGKDIADTAGKNDGTDATAVQSSEKDKSSGLVSQINDDIAKLLGDENIAEKGAPLVRVTSVEDGVAIELMDSQKYGMFAIGSARPDKNLIEILDGVAKILKKHSGEVIVSGHTDARPYKNNLHYDNWQLSSARAQMAYYMLVRGGLDEARVLRVEGYADRDLKNKQDPHAAENRRIAIFLKTPAGEGS